MEKTRIACFYYPTTVAFIDDDAHFLDATALRMSDRILCKTYTDPKQALDWLADKKTHNKIVADTMKVDVESIDYQHSASQLPVQFNISGLYQYAYDPELFNEASVVVIDYSMPTMNGEEFCRKLSNLPVKKLMLTGEADQSLAVKLFNEDVIDKFLTKGSASIGEDLLKAIADLQKQYFYDLTATVIKGLTTDSQSALADIAFIKFFEKTCTELSISSYYLIEPSGSFILIDQEGKITYLLVKTQEELLDLADELEDAEANADIVATIKAGKKIPYLPELESYTDIIDTGLEHYLYPAEKLEGQKTYAYALLKSVKGFEFHPKKVIAFKNQIIGSHTPRN